MRFKFIGKYTNGHSSINAWGLVFEGREPLDVPAELVEHFARHVEFERIENAVSEQAETETETEAETKAPHPLDHDGDGKIGGSLPDSVKPRKRGRPKKVAE